MYAAAVCCVCFVRVQTDVFIAMELMGTCAEKLKKRIQGPIPERILGKMTVAVSGRGVQWVGLAQEVERLLGSIPGSSWLSVEVSLSKSLNP